jgi:putative oxidoreductase
MFPTGLPGLALLLLRASVAIALVTRAYIHRPELAGWTQAAVILISLVISAGYLTPIVALMALALHAFLWSALGAGNDAMVIIILLDAVALVLLGPGAYSIDSYRFGRRVVVLPPP